MLHSSNVQVNFVKDATCDVVLCEPLRAKQVTRGMYYVPSNFFPMMPKIESKKEDKEVEELQCLSIEGREVKESDDLETSVVACIDNENSFEAMGCQHDEKVDFDACVDDKLMREMVDNIVDEPLVMNGLYGDLEHAICSNGHSFFVLILWRREA